ncbi:hypothetical protein LTR85_009175 [Meristemomyces frigidus]|nr:hypothetical protein LTR85_009175 [Meristemomyces frigidus]
MYGAPSVAQQIARRRLRLNRRKSFASFPTAATLQAWPIQNPPLANSTEHLLYRYLPGLAEACYEWDVNPEAAAQQLICESDDVAENGGLDELTMDDLTFVYGEVLSAIRRCRHHGCGDTAAVSCHLLSLLTNTLDEDDRHVARLRNGGHNQTLLLFLALSSISAQTQSRPMGVVLSKFFHENADDILREERINTVALWARGIHGAEMPYDDKFACLRKIVRRCPELLVSLEARETRAARVMAKVLRQVGEDIGPYGTLDGGRGSRGRMLERDGGLDSWNDRRGGRSRRRVFDDDDVFDSAFGSRGSRGVRDRPMIESGPYAHQIGRPRSAPGEKRRVVRQAERLLDAAEDMQVEVDKFRRVMLDDR